MTTFWKNLQQLAHGQLFNGGYLGVGVAEQQVKPATKAETRSATAKTSPRPVSRPPIAAYR